MTLHEIAGNNSLSQYRQLNADTLPSGRAWMAKNISGQPLYKICNSFAPELKKIEEKVNELWQSYDFMTSDKLIEFWEAQVGIPDSCIDVESTYDLRRNNIKFKINLRGTATTQDFIDIADILGLDIRVSGGDRWSNFPMEFPIFFTPNQKWSRFIMMVDFLGFPVSDAFTYTFPIIFGGEQSSKLKCIFNKLAPGNVKVIYRSFIFNSGTGLWELTGVDGFNYKK